MILEKTGENFEETKDVKKEYLEDFINYRNNYLDDLPLKRLMPGDENYYMYKCRGNFFMGVFGRIERLIRKGFIKDVEVIEEGRKFIEYVRNMDFTKFTSKKDIDKANEILDIMIKELSKKS